MTSLQDQISMKNGPTPFFPSVSMVYQSNSGITHFPYTQFFRGRYESSIPFIMDRRAGFVQHLPDELFTMNMICAIDTELEEDPIMPEYEPQCTSQQTSQCPSLFQR